MRLFNKDIWAALKNAYKTKRIEYKMLKESNKFLEKAKDLDVLKKWLNYKVSTVRANGVIEKIGIRLIHISISPTEGVNVMGELEDGTYLKEAYAVSQKDLERIASGLADQHMKKLEDELEYNKKEQVRIEKAIRLGKEKLFIEAASEEEVAKANPEKPKKEAVAKKVKPKAKKKK